MFDPRVIASDLRAPMDAELARIEDAGLNAAQPLEQLLVDGWLLRFSPGKARRARSINAISAGRLGLQRKLEICRRHYEQARLPLLFRITPFSLPASLDAFLERGGFQANDETRVMTRSLADEAISPRVDTGAIQLGIRSVDVIEFAAIVGSLRDSPAAQIRAHEGRLLGSPLRHASVRRVVYIDGAPVAAGQTVVEVDVAGLYDIVTAPRWRGQGIGAALTARLVAEARISGARTAYLQVDAGNTAARRIYAKLGFADRYSYWYRQPGDVIDELLH